MDFKTVAAERKMFPPVPRLGSDIDLTVPFEPPSAQHWLGTDKLGRDVTAGLIHGSRISLSIGFVAGGLPRVFWGALGALGGFFWSLGGFPRSRPLLVHASLSPFFFLL